MSPVNTRFIISSSACSASGRKDAGSLMIMLGNAKRIDLQTWILFWAKN